MAVAPINKVRQILDYAVTAIPAEKCELGVPNYGYDWTLPYERGVTRAVTIGNADAPRIAFRNNATIQFDSTALSPYFEYISEGTSHVVWFEDVRSLEAKLMLIPEYGMHGAGYWNLMRLFRPNWLLLNSMYRIREGTL